MNEVQTIPVLDGKLGGWHVSVRRDPLSAREIGHRYDRAAGSWQRTLVRLGVPRAYERLFGELVGDVAPAPGVLSPSVLDAGVGTGAMSIALARAVDAPFVLHALDLSPRMLHRAGTTLRAAGLEPVLRHGDVQSLPYADGVFDFVIAAHVLEHLADPAPALREMVRVLRPGGRLLVCVTRRSGPGLWVRLRWRTHAVEPEVVDDWLRRAGLGERRRAPLRYRSPCLDASVACIGTKPHAAA